MIAETVAAGAYRYYMLQGGSPTAAIIISVTPISGDPDLVVSSTSSPRGVTSPTLDPGKYCKMVRGEDGWGARVVDRCVHQWHVLCFGFNVA